jgi:hypothetical protein
VTTSQPRKPCSICGKNYPLSEFSYGNRENRSYCQTCNKLEKAARSLGGSPAARAFREEQRRSWR